MCNCYRKRELFLSFFFVVVLPAVDCEFIQSGSLRLASDDCWVELLLSEPNCVCCEDLPPDDCQALRSPWRLDFEEADWLRFSELARRTSVASWSTRDEVEGPTQLCIARTDCNAQSNATHIIFTNIIAAFTPTWCFILLKFWCCISHVIVLLSNVINIKTTTTMAQKLLQVKLLQIRLIVKVNFWEQTRQNFSRPNATSVPKPTAQTY